MEIIKIVSEDGVYGVYAYTERQEVIDNILDNIENKEERGTVLNMINEGVKLCFIPKDSKRFKWNENIHGKL